MSRAPCRSVLLALLPFVLLAVAVAPAKAEELDPLTLTKYMDPLPIPGVAQPIAPNFYEIGAYRIQQQLHSQLPPTTVYGYGTSEATASYPGPTIVAQKGVPIQIRWTNHLPSPHILSYAFDPTLMHAETTTGIPITTHVHGAEVEPQSDGGPMSWFTPDFAETGPTFAGEVRTYVNTQLPSTIWYHDHAFGYTRHNVYAGLAGFYIITDPATEPAGLPSAPYDLGLCLQDKMLTTDGQLWYPNQGETTIHPIWVPEFFGNLILVNGKIWPYLNVEPRKYRFRILNGAQARFFSLALSERVRSTPGPAFYQIATDGGYLAEPVLLNDPNDVHSPRLIVAPGERAEIVVDFSGLAPGTEFILKNTAKAPYPAGEAPNGQTTAQVMLFRVVEPTGTDTSVLPAQLATVTRLSNPTVKRVMTLNEIQTADGDPVEAVLNGMNYLDASMMPAGVTTPTLGATEMWEVVNMTGDAHPIHLHLVQYQLLNRQKVNVKRYEHAFAEANPVIPADHYVEVDPTPYLKGKPVPADPNERGWKDTYRMNPGEVTRVLIRFAPQDESPSFAFDATAEPGYVWHCHILEHEENDMMRTMKLVAPGSPPLAAAALAHATGAAPPVTALRVPAPNPAGDGAIFKFSLASPGQVDIHIFNASGRLVRTVASGWYPAGEHQISWRRADQPGRLPNGIYFVKLETAGSTRSQKLMLLQ
jgi:spore coat protein A, manganese oxidase